jgi:hypothetical protein
MCKMPRGILHIYSVKWWRSDERHGNIKIRYNVKMHNIEHDSLTACISDVCGPYSMRHKKISVQISTVQYPIVRAR